MKGRDVADLLGSELLGADRDVQCLATPAGATSDSVVVIASREDLEALGDRSPAVVVGPAEQASDDHPYVPVPSPRAALAELSRRLDRRPVPTGVSPFAHIDLDATLGAEVAVGPGTVVEAGASIGARSVIGSGCVIGAGAKIGAACRLHASVTLYDGVTIGDRTILHSGSVIGADGFGYAASEQGARKIHHLGSVRIGADVEIGANTCIDRGTLEDTVIGDRTKIDNLCQIAHNAVIGSDCLIAGMSGVSGSVRIGDRVTLAGNVGIVDHVTIGDGATIGGGSKVRKDIPAGETWMGYWAEPYRSYARSRYLQNRLEEIWEFVRVRR